MKRALGLALFASLAVVSVACGSSGTATFEDGADGGRGGSSGSSGGGFGESSGDGGAKGDGGAGCNKMDILFVVDNSGSMSEEQTNLAANFPKFVSVLDATTGPNGPLDYRVAVTTTGKSYKIKGPFGITVDDVKGDDGAFRNNCGGAKRWLDRGEAAASFGCRATVGTDGPSEEMPLQCMKMALTDRVADGTNAGFLRKDALLAIVFLTDEDDCSYAGKDLDEGFGDVCSDLKGAEKPQDYVTMLDGLTGDRARWATAVIAGKSSCTSTFGSAAEAKRLGDFVTATGKNAVFSSICDGDLSKSLKEAIDKFGTACRDLPPPPR